MYLGDWQLLAWLGWIIAMLWPKKSANNLSLGNCFFWRFWQWSQVFLWQVILFLYKACLKSRFPERGQHWAVSFLTAPKTAFSRKSIAPKSIFTCYFTPHMGSTHFLVLPKTPHCQISCQGFASSVSLPRNDSVKLWLLPGHTLCSTFYCFRSLAPPDCWRLC